MPTASLLADDLEARLRVHANAERAVNEQTYLKSNLDFIGAGVPAIRLATREFLRAHPLDRRTLLAIVRALWSRRLHEDRIAAIVLLHRNIRFLTSNDLAFIERLMRDSHTWAYVDVLAIDIAGALVERDPSLMSTLDRWSTDADFWVRRASMLALLPSLRYGEDHFARFARYADSMLDEREFFIRKAIGWVLRETSKRRPELVFVWLLPRAARASGVTVREAVKYLSQQQREEILAASRRALKPAPVEQTKRPTSVGRTSRGQRTD